MNKINENSCEKNKFCDFKNGYHIKKWVHKMLESVKIKLC